MFFLLELFWVGDSKRCELALMTRDVYFLIMWQVPDIDFTKINSR